MTPTLEIALPEGARLVAGALAAAGYDTLLVGGTVRDALLGRTLGDIDIATSATPDDASALVSRLPWVEATWASGARFGTLGISALGSRIEVTTLRGGGEAGADVASRFAADARMRDFTINALGLVLPSAELLDPLDGRRDLAERVLRAPDPPASRFAEDPIRVLRLARFSAELGFDIDPATLRGATESAGLVSVCAAERIHSELWRLLAAPAAVRGVRVLRETGALAAVLPEASVDEDTIALVGLLPSDPERRLAALLGEFSEAALATLCERLRCSRAQHRRIAFFLRHGLEADPEAPAAVSPLGGNTIIRELGVAPGPMVGMVKAALAEAVAEGLLDSNDREGALALARTVMGIPSQPVTDRGATHE